MPSFLALYNRQDALVALSVAMHYEKKNYRRPSWNLIPLICDRLVEAYESRIIKVTSESIAYFLRFYLYVPLMGIHIRLLHQILSKQVCPGLALTSFGVETPLYALEVE